MFDAVDHATESAQTEKHRRIYVLKLVLPIMRVIERIAKCIWVPNIVNVIIQVCETMMQKVVVPFPFLRCQYWRHGNVRHQPI